MAPSGVCKRFWDEEDIQSRKYEGGGKRRDQCDGEIGSETTLRTSETAIASGMVGVDELPSQDCYPNPEMNILFAGP